jgi:hypothetical protein
MRRDVRCLTRSSLCISRQNEAYEKGANHGDPLLNFRIDAGVGVLRTHRATVDVQEFYCEDRSGMGTLPAAV